MPHWFKLFAVVIVAAAAVSCESGRHSSAGFRLPNYGDAERGKLAFLDLKCNTCHQVAGVDLPASTARPNLTVTLGGERFNAITDGYLVTSIINPSFRLAAERKDLITEAGHSRMPEYAHQMSVRQLTDLVAFLQAHYSVRRLDARNQEDLHYF